MITHRFVLPLVVGTTVLACIGACTRRAAEQSEPQNEVFDPRITVDWPAPPSESRHESPETKSYTAIAILRKESTFATFHLTVTNFSEDSVRKETTKGLIEASAFAGRNSETSRKAIEISPKKYPGLQITRQVNGPKGRTIFSRDIVFMAGTRLVDLSAGGTDEAYINGPEVDAFFDSLKIRD